MIVPLFIHCLLDIKVYCNGDKTKQSNINYGQDRGVTANFALRGQE
jgi:hypothetical protein